MCYHIHLGTQAFDNVTNIVVFDKVIQCINILKKKGMNALIVGMQVFYLEDQVSTILWQSEKHILSVMKKRNYVPATKLSIGRREKRKKTFFEVEGISFV